MAINNLSTDQLVVTVNGRIMSDWGESDPAISVDPIDPSGVLRRGQGGNAIRLNRLNPGRTVTLNLNPASPDSAYMSGLLASSAGVTVSVQQVGTLENALYSEGMIVNVGTHGRGGQTVTDDQYIMEFNVFNELKGGE